MADEQQHQGLVMTSTILSTLSNVKQAYDKTGDLSGLLPRVKFLRRGPIALYNLSDGYETNTWW